VSLNKSRVNVAVVTHTHTHTQLIWQSTESSDQAAAIHTCWVELSRWYDDVEASHTVDSRAATSAAHSNQKSIETKPRCFVKVIARLAWNQHHTHRYCDA